MWRLALDPPAPYRLQGCHRLDPCLWPDVVTAMCDRLRTGDAPALHFYTMNQNVPGCWMFVAHQIYTQGDYPRDDLSTCDC